MNLIRKYHTLHSTVFIQKHGIIRSRHVYKDNTPQLHLVEQQNKRTIEAVQQQQQYLFLIISPELTGWYLKSRCRHRKRKKTRDQLEKLNEKSN